MAQQDGMEMNRRDFVSAAAAAAAGIGILAGACGSAKAQTATQPAPDAAPLDVGLKTDFSKDGPVMTWEMDNHIIIVREDGKIYALSSKCTHKGCDIDDTSGSFACGCHGSTFGYDGKVTMGPARKSLNRYGISVNAAGHVLVDKSKTFTDAQWDDAASFITVA